MARIKILPLHEAQKIAAGEVVERPANVVKELLENALDAGATQITLYIGKGGKQLIRIIDNGSGMSSEDARLCILPHATSKISSVDELDSLETFGFRGEALASIAAVSKFKLVTRCTDASEALKLTIEAGTILKEEVIAANGGTDITIEDLFYNVPARQKFLKTEKTEWHAIQQLMHAYALDYPQVQFTLYHNQQRILSCVPVETIQARAPHIFDQTITERLLALSSEKENADRDISIEGIISDHQYGRYDRSHIYLFVNKRWVKNHKLAQAIIKGYQGVLQQGHYPCAIISITVPLHTVDINIHPRKEEVQFLHPRIVEDHIYSAVKKRLEDHIAQRLNQPRVSHVSYQAQPNFAPQTIVQPPAIPTITLPYNTTVQLEKEPFQEVEEVAPILFEQAIDQQQTVVPAETAFTIKGQFALTYIMVETDAGLLLIDQHAAHERILYEQIGNRMHNPEVIRLLFPEQIRLAPADYALAIEELELLRIMGIEAEAWSDYQILVTATPVYVKPHMLKDILLALVDAIRNKIASETAHKKIQHAVQAMMACKAAIKANDILQPEEMETMIQQLFVTPNRLTCPHGRPTSWLLSIPEIERKFKRIL